MIDVWNKLPSELLRQLPSTCLRTNWLIIGTIWSLQAEAYQAHLHISNN